MRRLRSLAVSLFTTAVDLGLFCLCTLVATGSTSLCLARWSCGMVGAALNFILNRTWAFRDRRERFGAQLGRYGVVACSAVIFTTALFWVLRLLTSFDPRLLHPASLGLVWLGFTYPMLRDRVFR